MARKKKKPASGKKKRSRKKKREETEKAASADIATPAETANGASAEIATPAETGAPAAESTAPTDEPPHVEQIDGEPPIVDLDAEEPAIIDLDDEESAIVDLDDDLDGDEESDDLVAALIAETVATAPVVLEPDDPEPPVIDLDADMQAEHTVEQSPADISVDAAAEATATQPAPARAERTAETALRLLADLGSVSSPEIRDRLLAEALAHAEHKDARYRVPFSGTPTAARWKALAALVTLLLAGLVALAPPGWARPDTPAELAATERAHGLRLALLLQAEQIEAFRVREQRLPETLADVGDALPGLRYVLSGSRAYQLVAYLPDGTAVVYDSARPMPGFEAVEPAWRPEEGIP